MKKSGCILGFFNRSEERFSYNTEISSAKSNGGEKKRG